MSREIKFDDIFGEEKKQGLREFIDNHKFMENQISERITLETYKELEEAYEQGGEWCNYGWSDGQMALFPTQQKTFDGLQKIEGHENDCGRPGVNGGYMANPALKFGVNCFGYKPVINSTEQDLMANEPLYPKTLKDIAMENRVNYWKDKLATILVSPFNSSSWSRL